MSEDPNASLAQSLNIVPRRSLGERFLRWLGFSWPPYPNMDDLDRDPRFTAGYVVVNLHLKLDLRDRLLVLLGGNVAVRSFIKTDMPLKASTTRCGWSVLEPGKEFR